MVLRFKQRGVTDLKKVVVYGNDGTGKSTFAANYCRQHGLNPVVIDIDDTNYTNLPILDLDFGSDNKTYETLKKAIADINKSDFDTIIVDGATSMLEMLTSKAKGMKKYSDRAERFQDILRALQSSGKHLIFVGQADMEVIYNDDFQSSKMVIKLNSIANEKYLCYKKKDGFSSKCVKYRTLEAPSSREIIEDENIPEVVHDVVPEVTPSVPQEDFVSASEIGEPKLEDDPVRNSCIMIKTMLEKEGKLVTKQSMKAKVLRLVQEEVLPPENKPALIEYIQKHCPEELP